MRDQAGFFLVLAACASATFYFPSSGWPECRYVAPGFESLLISTSVGVSAKRGGQAVVFTLPGGDLVAKAFRRPSSYAQELGAMRAVLDSKADASETHSMLLPVCVSTVLRTIVFPRMADGDLGAALRWRTVDPALFDELLAQIVRAVHDVHVAGLLHMDVKPENLLVSWKDRRVFLIDYGLATPDPALESSLIPGALQYGLPRRRDSDLRMVGTRRYMAPEVLQAAHRRTPVGRGADWWSVGVTLHVLAASRGGRARGDAYPYVLDEDDAMVWAPRWERLAGASARFDLAEVLFGPLGLLSLDPGAREAGAQVLLCRIDGECL